MRLFYITFRSVTYAQRGEAVLSGGGIRCQLQRTPRWMEERGCGYCLRLWAPDPGPALALLRDSRVPMGKLYIQNPDGRLEEQEV